MPRATSKGQCRLCGGEYSKSGMTKHLQVCRSKKEETSEAGGKKSRPARSLHVVVSGRYAPMYWTHLEAPADATLAGLDDFLRNGWLECCGHLSAFTIGGASYASTVDREWGMDERSMDVRLGKVLTVGDVFAHEYDFGSTTNLTLKVVGERQSPRREQDIQILAQNEPPSVPCDACGNQATEVCAQCSWSGEGWLCEEHSESHKCGEEMLLPVVNSPRVGVCGYTG